MTCWWFTPCFGVVFDLLLVLVDCVLFAVAFFGGFGYCIVVVLLRVL